MSLNKFIDDYCRKGSKRYEVSLPDGMAEHSLPDSQSPEEIYITTIREELLKEILEKWEPKCQNYYEDLLVKEKKYEEIAFIQSLKSANHARSQWHRCKAFLFRIFMEKKEYLELGLEFLRDWEIKNMMYQFKDDLENIWAYVQNPHKHARAAYYDNLKSQNSLFSNLLVYLKRQAGYRKILIHPFIIDLKINSRNTLDKEFLEIWDKVAEKKIDQLELEKRFEQNPIFYRKWRIWQGIEEALVQWRTMKLFDKHMENYEPSYFVIDQSELQDFLDKYLNSPKL